MLRRAEDELFGSTGLNNMVVPGGRGALLSIVTQCVSTAILYTILIVKFQGFPHLKSLLCNKV